jgi:integrase
VQRTINIGKAAISRASKRGELSAMPFILSVVVRGHPPKGRPMEVQEIARLYVESARHLKTYIRWALGTAARPEAVIGLRSEQVERTHGVVHLNPEGREQNKKHRPIVKLPKTLPSEAFDGWLITVNGEHVKGIRTAWLAAVRRQNSMPRAVLTHFGTRRRAGCACTGCPLRRSRSRWGRGSSKPQGFTPSTTRST